MSDSDLGLLQGTLDLLVLKVLVWGPRHGYGIARWIREQSDETLVVEDRALYLSLHRLEARGLIESTWGASENNRRARFYQVTAQGRAQLRTRISHWERYAAAVAKIIHAAEPVRA